MSLRIYELARKLGMPSKELVEECKQRGMKVSTHSSAITEEEAAQLRASLRKKLASDRAKGPSVVKAPTKRKAKAPPRAPRKAAPVRVAPTRAREKEKPKPERVRPKTKPKPTTDTAAERKTSVRQPAAARAKPRRLLRKWTAPPATRKTAPAPTVERPTGAEIEEPIVVKTLSAAIGVKASEIIGKLLAKNILVTINEPIDADIAVAIAEEFGTKLEVKRTVDIEEVDLEAEPDPEGSLRPRAPIVTFLGHVDHGKTSLLDRIRQTDVVKKEHGGITQQIGASRVRHDDRFVVFLDTPGHEAFTEMRARGANVTDVVVLVVAADDGVMPQTEEAIAHARAGKVPIVVAINKMDKPNANPERVKQQLSKLELAPEEWGGKTVFIEVSALTGQGVAELMEMLVLEAELLELKANPDKAARGVVLEARRSEGRGVVAAFLVQEGTLHRGDVVLCGHVYGRARAMHDEHGRSLKAASPSMPVEVLGLPDVPDPGSKFVGMDDPQKARVIADSRARKRHEAARMRRRHVTLESLFAQIEAGESKELRVVLKTDTGGSLEVIRKSLLETSSEEVKVNTLHAGVGGINQSDVVLADASDAVIVGFSVVAEPAARELAEEKGVEVRLYQVIYELTEDINKARQGMLEPEQKEVVTGHAEIRQVFRVSRIGNIAGCFVTDGVINRSSLLRLIRENVVIYSGKIESLKRFKDDVREVRDSFECGIKIEGYDDIKEGDIIEAYQVELVERTLS